jgi:uncharacterized membrane protein
VYDSTDARVVTYAALRAPPLMYVSNPVRGAGPHGARRTVGRALQARRGKRIFLNIKDKPLLAQTQKKEAAEKTRRQARPMVVIAGIVGFWLLLWGAGFPPPMGDDLFFLGGAVNLERTGTLANPWIRFWNPVAESRFYFQPPLYEYAAAAWISLFGLSAASLTGFQCLLGAITSLAVVCVFRRFGFGGSAWIPLLLAVALSTQGLRHDALGLLLLASGLWLVVGHGSTRYAAGLSVLTLAPAAWPLTVCYAVPAAVAAVASRLWRERTRARAKVAVLSGLALLVALFVVLVSVDFQVRLFVGDFLWHAHVRRPNGMSRTVGLIVHLLTGGWNALLLGPVCLLMAGLVAANVARWSHVRREIRLLIGVAATGMLIELVLYPAHLDVLFALMCSVFVVVLSGEVWSGSTRVPLASVVLVVALTPNIGYSALRWLGPARESAAYYAQVRRSVAGARTVVVDEYAARSVFDYRLPPDAVFWDYSLPADQFWPKSLAERRPGTVWVLSRAKGSMVKGMPRTAPLRFLGHSFGSIPARPGLMCVVR